MKMLNKIFYIVATIVEALLILGIFVINYFTRTRMGMARHVSARNFLWENAYDITKIKYLSIIVIVIMMILSLLFFVKRKKYINHKVSRTNIIMIILGVIYTVFILRYSTYDYKAYYYICLMLFLATILQIIKAIVKTILCENQ